MSDYSKLISRAEAGDAEAGFTLLEELADFLDASRQGVKIPAELALYGANKLRKVAGVDDLGAWVPVPETAEDVASLADEIFDREHHDADTVLRLLNIRRPNHRHPRVGTEAKALFLALLVHRKAEAQGFKYGSISAAKDSVAQDWPGSDPDEAWKQYGRQVKSGDLGDLGSFVLDLLPASKERGK